MTTDAEVGLDMPKQTSAPLAELLNRLLKGEHGGAIAEAISTGRVDKSLVEAFLGHAKLTPEQQSLVKLVMAKPDVAETHETRPGAHSAERDDSAADLHSVRRELEDLRQVNDTVAAALGACPICWGGDRECAECEGRGAAGSAAPDRKLFEELVVPAVRRVSAQRRSASRDPRRYGR